MVHNQRFYINICVSSERFQLEVYYLIDSNLINIVKSGIRKYNIPKLIAMIIDREIPVPINEICI